MTAHSDAQEFSLYGRHDGARKYLNREERQRALVAMQMLPPDQALFCLTLAWSGARVSEVLALTPVSFQADGVVAFRTLKRRKHVVREVPLPPGLLRAVETHFGFAAGRLDATYARQRLWPWCRVSAWRLVKRVMIQAEITGSRASPRGLRHSFAIGALQAGIPLNIVQRWLGHARISTTAIYASACGPEEIAFAARFWRPTAVVAMHVSPTL